MWGGCRSCWAPKDPVCLYLIYFIPTRRKSSSSFCYLLCSVSIFIFLFSWWRDDQPPPSMSHTYIDWASYPPQQQLSTQPTTSSPLYYWMAGVTCPPPLPLPLPPFLLTCRHSGSKKNSLWTIWFGSSPSVSRRHVLIREDDCPLAQEGCSEHYLRRGENINGSLYEITAVRDMKAKIS